MKQYKLILVGGIVALSAFLMNGCKLSTSYDYSPYQHIQVEEEAYLSDDVSSPFCDFSLYFSSLNEEDDSIALLINRTIQQKFLGDEYADLTPSAAVDSFKNTYLRNYRKETGSLYQKEIERTTSAEEIPDWFNQTYSMVTMVEEGKENVVNATANMFVDMGGAHPNQWSHWLNFNLLTGKLLNKDDVFLKSAEADLERMLLDKLILQQAELYPEENIATLEDLQQKGFLQLTNIYIPDNFLLAKNGVMFLFNRYDIAPYSSGSIVLTLTYEEADPFLKDI